MTELAEPLKYVLAWEACLTTSIWYTRIKQIMPHLGSVRGQVRWSFQQPGVVKGVPAHNGEMLESDDL